MEIVKRSLRMGGASPRNGLVHVPAKGNLRCFRLVRQSSRHIFVMVGGTTSLLTGCVHLPQVGLSQGRHLPQGRLGMTAGIEQPAVR